MGRYISIEKAITDTKDAYYHALAAANAGWHANKNDPRPFIEYLLGVVLSCVNALEACPSLGSSSVESALKKLVDDGALRGRGDTERAKRMLRGARNTQPRCRCSSNQHRIRQLGTVCLSSLIEANLNNPKENRDEGVFAAFENLSQ